MANKKVMPLRGLIYQKFESESDLARRIGWDRRRLNKITNGVKEPDIQEAATLAQALGTSVDRIADIFCPESHQTGDNGPRV